MVPRLPEDHPDFARSREEAKRILALIVQVNGARLWDRTRLNKAFYWAHRFYWEEQRRLLTGWAIAVAPKGPVPDQFRQLLPEIHKEGYVHEGQVDLPGAAPPAINFWYDPGENKAEGSDAEIAAIRRALAKVEGKSAGTASDESHKLSRTWREGLLGDRMPYLTDSIPDDELERETRELAEERQRIEQLFG